MDRKYFECMTELGLEPGFTEKDLRKKWLELLKKYHPDKYQTEDESIIKFAEEKIIKINEAYEYLKENFLESKEEDIDTDSDNVIEPAMNFFKNLQIPKRLAPYVETIYMDGGNDVYMNIIPQWDGEDESFDLNEIALTELQQFPNLKEATLMSSNFDKVKDVFDVANIKAELL